MNAAMHSGLVVWACCFVAAWAAFWLEPGVRVCCVPLWLMHRAFLFAHNNPSSVLLAAA